MQQHGDDDDGADDDDDDGDGDDDDDGDGFVDNDVNRSLWSKLCLINEAHLAAGVTKPGNFKCWKTQNVENTQHFKWSSI